MIKRLRRKFVCINMAIVSFMLAMMLVNVFRFTQEDLLRQGIRAIDMASEQYRYPKKSVEKPPKIPYPYFAVEIGADGTRKLYNDGEFDLSDEELIRQLVQTAQTGEENVGVIQAHSLRYNRFPTPTAQWIVFMDISPEIETLKGLVRSCILIGCGGFAVFWGISALLAQWAIRPVEEAWNRQREFVADASHELKTPLAVITTSAELLQDPSYSEAERRQFADNMLTMSRQMSGLVEGLLELARVDNGLPGMRLEKMDYSELVQSQMLLFEPLFYENDRSLESRVEEELFVRGSQRHLQQVLEILLDNALKYSDRNSCVKAELQRKGSYALLAVTSSGEPISKEDLTNIFKRFYRIDKARSMNRSYGLGLSIALGIIKLHGGKIWAESADGGNTFYVLLSLTER